MLCDTCYVIVSSCPSRRPGSAGCWMNKGSMGSKGREEAQDSRTVGLFIPETAAGTRPQSSLSKLTCPALEACNLKGLAHQGAPSNNVGDNVGCLPVSLSAFFSSQRKRTPAELLILESTVDLAEWLPRRWVSNSAPTVQTDPAARAASGAWSEAAGPACQLASPSCSLCAFLIELGGSSKAG